MKRYLLFSDTHGKTGNLEWVLRTEDPFYGVCFCGDGEGLENILRNLPGCPPVIHMVAGNNDWYSALPEDAVFPLGCHRVLMTHGHRFGIRRGLSVLGQYARLKECDLCFFGHSHRPCEEVCEGVLCVNPGSLSEPRQDPCLPSYMVITVADDGETEFELKYVNPQRGLSFPRQSPES